VYDNIKKNATERMGSRYFGEVIDVTKSQGAASAQMVVSGDVGLL
jgi:hypothetical protein